MAHKSDLAVLINEIQIPRTILKKWRLIVDLLSEIFDVPAALITKIEPPHIRVVLSNESAGNLFYPGASIHIQQRPDSFTFYCEKVFSTKAACHIPDASKVKEWKHTLGPQFGLISYLGYPIFLPDGSVFGTICVMDKYEKDFKEKHVAVMLQFKDLVESHLYLICQQSTLKNQIDELKRMEAELQNHRHHLEELVDRRTHELADSNTQLLLEIDERKQAEKSLHESETRFRSLVEYSLTGISIYQNGRCIYQNPEHVRLLGTMAKTMTKPYPDNIHPEDASKVSALYESLFSEETSTGETDFRFFSSDQAPSEKSMRWVQCRATLVNIDDSRAILTNMMDISRTKELEHLMRIEDKMSSLGRIATGIVHEIRNPLSAINMYLGALKDAVGDGDAEEVADFAAIRRIPAAIQAASSKMEAVIRKVMDFSKPTTPKRVLTNINAPVKKALDLSAVAIRKAGVKLEKNLAENMPACYVDAQMMEEVFLNLINNAMQALATVSDPKRIRIESILIDRSILVTVSDSGPGVPPMLRPKIFDPFFTTKGDGAGIGLSMARRIVVDHGGTLSVSASCWGGAAFTMAIPFSNTL